MAPSPSPLSASRALFRRREAHDEDRPLDRREDVFSLPAESREADSARTVEQIGRYLLFESIGRGGMGAVHLGLMTGAAGFSRWVAIKKLKAEWASDPKLKERFKVEVRLSASVVHANVVQTLDVLDADGELLLVMDYVEGVTLAGLLADLRKSGSCLTPELAVAIAIPALRGLHAAHVACDASGRLLEVVHRDVSPQNVMIDADGHVRVLDFGVARAAAYSQITTFGSFAGKVSYVAPEQLSGMAEPRTDVFAAGVVLWEMLTGRRLFRRGDLTLAEALLRTLSGRIPRPREMRPDLPVELDEIVACALEREPARRHASAKAFAEALQATVAPAPASELADLIRTVSAQRLALARHAVQRARRLHADGAAALAVSTEVDGVTSEARSEPRAAPRTRRVLRYAAAALIAIAAGTLGARLQPFAAAPPPHVPTTRERSSVSTAPASGLATQATLAKVGPVELIAPRGEPTAPEPRVSAASTHRPRARLRAKELARSSGTRASPAARAGLGASEPAARAALCDPPTYRDAAGIRRFKEGCL